MKLGALLSADRILVDVAGETVREVARELVQALIDSGNAADPDRLEELLAESLPSEAVTVGQRAFLLQFRDEAVEALTVALGVTAVPVHREHDPGKEARVVLMIVGPPGDATDVLRALATFARTLASEDITRALESASRPEDVLAINELTDVEIGGELQVRDVMTVRFVHTGADATLSDAASIMIRHRVPALPVVSESNEVLGMVTHAELLRYLIPASLKRHTGEHPAPRTSRVIEEPGLVPVRDVMDRSVLCISDDQLLPDVANLLVNKKLERVPVVRDGVLVGVLTRDNIVRRLFS